MSAKHDRDAPLESDRPFKIPKVIEDSEESTPATHSDSANVLKLSYDRSPTFPLDWNSFRTIVVFSCFNGTWIGYLCNMFPSDSQPEIQILAMDGDSAEDDLKIRCASFLGSYPTKTSLDDKTPVLFVIWVGMNDIGRADDPDDLGDVVEQIFDTMHELYTKLKGRSFLLIDIPPIHRSPVGKLTDTDEERFNVWNNQLIIQAEAFAKAASQASVFVFSSYTVVSDFLDHPAKYNLLDCIEGEELSSNKDDGRVAMWADDYHLSSGAHRKVAERLWETFWRGQPRRKNQCS